jgi:hypothetical protein
MFTITSLILLRSSSLFFFSPIPYCSVENGWPTSLKVPGLCAA